MKQEKIIEEMKRKNLNKIKKNKSDMADISQNWLSILIPFSYDYNKKFSGSELSRIVGIPQRSVSRYLFQIVKRNLLKFEVRGKNKFYYLDLGDERTKVILNLIESYKSFIFSLNNKLWKDLDLLREFGTIVLFGSQVKGYSDSSSDVDIVIFAKKTEKLKRILRTLPKVQSQIISFKNFEKLIYKKDVLATEILKNHVVFGDVSKFVDLCWRYYNG